MRSTAAHNYRLTIQGKEKLERAIKERGVAQTTIAAEAGIQPNTVSRIRNGRPGYEWNIVRLFQAAGIKAEPDTDYEPVPLRSRASGPGSVVVSTSLHVPGSKLFRDWAGAHQESKPRRAYHSLLRESFAECCAEPANPVDRDALWEFPNAPAAERACRRMLDALEGFNSKWAAELDGCHLLPRFGIDVMTPARRAGEGALPSNASMLGAMCPPGRISISSDVLEQLPNARRRGYRPLLGLGREPHCYVSVDCAQVVRQEGTFSGLSPQQEIAVGPIGFPTWRAIGADPTITLTEIGRLFDEPTLVILGATRTGGREGPLESAATSDVLGIWEATAALAPMERFRVTIDQWQDSADLIADRNVIVIGSPKVNCFAWCLNKIIEPVRFAESEGMFAARIETQDKTYGYGASEQDTGLLLACRNPFNPDKALLWVAGITGLGTQAAECLLRDIVLDSLDDHTAAILAKRPVACVVSARSSSPDWSVWAYKGQWRLTAYTLRCAIDARGAPMMPVL